MAGIYIHIPFCKSFCGYCDFYSVTGTEETGRFVDAVIREATLQAGYLEGEEVGSVYFGGGTPTLLSVSDFERIMSSLAANFRMSDSPEVTAEVNPDDVRPGYLRDLSRTGVNRLSVGIQTWNDNRLKYLGRRHDAAQSALALDIAFNEGYENVSADLIFGIPGTDAEYLGKDLEQTFRFPVTHLSAYHLTIEEGTKFGKMKKEGRLAEVDEEVSTAMFSLLAAECASRGFIRYEISNYARDGYFSKHNSSYWKQAPYLGLGPSAHSFNCRSRQWNISNVKKYLQSVERGIVPFEQEELSRVTMFNEYVMTSLRTMWGIDLEHVERMYDKELSDYLVNLSDKYIRYGMMRHEKNTLILTDQGKMISDNIIAELLMEL